MYVAVKGGEQAIDNAHRLLAAYCRGDAQAAEVSVAQLSQQCPFAISRIMAEGSLYDRDLAGLALKQAGGDLVEAIFLIRAFRTTLSRFGYSAPIDTRAMRIERRISAVYKDLPGGQVLGPTFDYTHRLLNFQLLENPAPVQTDIATAAAVDPSTATDSLSAHRVSDLLRQEGLLSSPTASAGEPVDLSLEPLTFPAQRSTRLQALARGDEGFLMSMAYSTQRGYARNHPFAGEIRMGWVEVEFYCAEMDDTLCLGEIEVSECDMVNQFVGSKDALPQFTQGYGLSFGYNERKIMAMALVDRALRGDEFNEPEDAPAQQQEFVLAHCDALDASGFVSHLKLPHYVDFQSELELIRSLRAKASAQQPSENPSDKRSQPSVRPSHADALEVTDDSAR